MQYCSLQHRTLLPSLVASTAGCWFYFGSMPSFFLVLFLHLSPVAYRAPIDLGIPLSVSYHSAFSKTSLNIWKFMFHVFLTEWSPLEKGMANHFSILALRMKRQKDSTLKEELPRSVGAQYANGDRWRNNIRKNEVMEPKQKQPSCGCD